MFRIRFFPDPNQIFFSFVRIWIRIGQKSGSDPEKSGSVKKSPETEVQVENKFVFHIKHSQVLNTFFFGQAPPKLNQNII